MNLSWIARTMALIVSLSLLSGCYKSISGSPAVLYWRDMGPEHGELGSWTSRQSLGADRIVGSPVNALIGTNLDWVVEVQPGDHTNSQNTERAELALSTELTGGTDGEIRYYSWSALFMQEWEMTSPSGWAIVTQWHQSGYEGCSPNIAFKVEQVGEKKNIYLEVRGGSVSRSDCSDAKFERVRLVPLVLGHLYSFSIGVSWSDDETGEVRVWNGSRPLARVRGVPTLYPGSTSYLKQGIYRSKSEKTFSYILGGTRVGPSLESVKSD
ncbi:MAG: hypothetical protein DI630_04635 [Gordonia sp. (in: high G+C Gram-positive bacteria)]|nr:MAG: hypothetical protein DI630_04635 [Gordonia sp. (in: high G+C Gram-positive bacteria)]